MKIICNKNNRTIIIECEFIGKNNRCTWPKIVYSVVNPKLYEDLKFLKCASSKHCLFPYKFTDDIKFLMKSKHVKIIYKKSES